MPCVNDHPDFLKMAAEWAIPQINDLLSAQALSVQPTLAVAMAQSQHHHHHHGDDHHDHQHSHPH
jgi:ferrochelatase